MPYRRITAYLRNNPHSAIVFLIILGITVISIPNLTTWPRIFYDEGITIEIARNFQLFGVLDISTAPGVFTDIPYVTGSNGFPVTLPLALFFQIFGFGLYQARIYALLWLITFLGAVYLFVKKFWGKQNAIGALLFLATFAPVYDAGRRVLGEIPGFVFLLAGLFFLMARNKALIAGIFFGLATISKPSVYLLIAPAFILTAFFINRDLRKKIFPLLTGIAPSLIIWVYFAFPDPFSIATWGKILFFYQNPAASASLFENLISNLSLFLSHTTLIYFSLISIFIAYVLISLRRPIRADLFLSFLIPYSILLLLYFLKSPGWLKYILPLQLFILILLPEHIRLFLAKLDKIRYYHAIITAFALLQGAQLFFFSNITNPTSEPEDIAKFLLEKPGMVGLINSPHIAPFIPPERKIHYLVQNDLVIIGQNPLGLRNEELPRFLIIPSSFDGLRRFSEEQNKNLGYYTIIRKGDWKVFELIK